MEDFRDWAPHLDLVHQVTIQGALGWDTLIHVATCMQRVDAEFLSFKADRATEGSNLIRCRLKSLDFGRLDSLVSALRSIDNVEGVFVTHIFGRTKMQHSN